MQAEKRSIIIAGGFMKRFANVVSLRAVTSTEGMSKGRRT
jgi:hypothetical protein